MTTARNLIEKAMRKVGILTLQETATANEANNALESLNNLLGSWSNDSLYISARSLESYTLVSGQAEYTIGATGDFAGERPIKIIDAYFRNGDIDYPLDMITDEGYANISFKGITGFPEFINYTNGYPLGTIKIYPTPSTAYTLYLLTEKPVTEIDGLDTDVLFPPGWERALIYSLAIDLAPEYGQPVDPTTQQIAEASKASIKEAISINRTLDAPTPLGTGNNIFTGYYTR